MDGGREAGDEHQTKGSVGSQKEAEEGLIALRPLNPQITSWSPADSGEI
jgi:hypothetical protein